MGDPNQTMSSAHMQALCNDWEALKQKLNTDNQLLNIQDDKGKTILFYLLIQSRQWDERTLKSRWEYLLSLKPTLSLQDEQGDTLIHRIVANLDIKTISGWLMNAVLVLGDEQKFNFDMENHAGQTYGDIIEENCETEYYRSHGLEHPLQKSQTQCDREMSTILSFTITEITDENIGMFHENLHALTPQKQVDLLDYVILKWTTVDVKTNPTLETQLQEIDEHKVLISFDECIQKMAPDNKLDEVAKNEAKTRIIAALRELRESCHRALTESTENTKRNQKPALTYTNVQPHHPSLFGSTKAIPTIPKLAIDAIPARKGETSPRSL